MSGAVGALDKDAVRDELRRVLASADFETSERNRGFLSYVVEETLGGRADRIKAYNIATSVFGRDASFDPQVDSIVRIEAGRLRRALDHYYLTAGQANPVRIAIPRGGYVPIFERSSCAQDGLPDMRPHMAAAPPRRGCVLRVAELEEEGDHSAFPNFCRGLTRQIIAGLTRFSGLFILGPDASGRDAGGAEDGTHPGQPEAELMLTGGAMLSSGHLTLEVLLSDARTGRYIWGETFERRLDPAEITPVRDEIASSVVRSLAQPYGVIFAERAREVAGKPPESLSSFDSVVRYYQYARNYDRSQIGAVRQGLELAIRRDPGCAEAFACLAHVCIDLVRFSYEPPAEHVDFLARAVELALRAVELAPYSSHSHHALGLAYWFSGDVDGGMAELRTGLSLNPNDSEVMAELGLRHAVLMEWDKAVPLLTDSFARNPGKPGISRIGLALYHYMNGRYLEALTEMRRGRTDHVVQAPAVVAAAAAKLGLAEEAAAAVQSILRIDPAYGDNVVADLTARRIHPEIIAAVVDGLRQAGLQGRDTGVPRILPAAPRRVLRLHVAAENDAVPMAPTASR